MTIARVLVTGAGGFLGSYCMRALLARGCTVAVLQRSAELPERLADLAGQLTVIQGDLFAADWAEQAKAFAPDAVLHMAWGGVAGSARNDIAQADNIPATLRLAALARDWGARHFIGAGSQAEYGPLNRLCSETDPALPTTLYGHAKLAACNMTQAFCGLHDLRFAWLRIFSTYGPQDHMAWMIPSLINNLLAGQCPPLTRGEQRWDFLHARDAAAAFAAVVCDPQAVGVFNLGSGTAPPLAETITIIRDAIDPALPLGFGQVPYRPDQVMHLQADIGRLKQVTGWQPQIKLRDGLNETVAWYAERFKEREHATG